MNASSPESATEINYLITNQPDNKATGEWIVKAFQIETILKSFIGKLKDG